MTKPMTQARILIVGTNVEAATDLRKMLSVEGYEISSVRHPKDVGGHADRFNLILTDLPPQTDDLTCLRQLRGLCPKTPIVLMTAHGSLKTAVEGLKAGAFDYVSKPFTADEVRSIARRAVEHTHMSSAQPGAGDVPPEETSPFASLVGESPSMVQVYKAIARVAQTDSSVLLQGESGTGKEMIGRLVHELDPRASGNELVIVDCTTIAPELSGSEFFGHERGAFTGAVAARDGAFAEANGGTLFLDEVGELPHVMQAQLLRVVQEGTYKRVGSNAWQRSQFRLVSATNRDLLQSIERGEFRHDLYHRIGGWIFRVPSLRERPEDVLALARHFLSTFLPDLSVTDFDLPVREYLLRRAYPGNIRDLRQLIARICSRHVGPGPITIGDLPDDEHPIDMPSRDDWRVPEFERSIAHALSLGVGLKEISQAAAETATRIAVEEENGSLRDAARRLVQEDAGMPASPTLALAAELRRWRYRPRHARWCAPRGYRWDRACPGHCPAAGLSVGGRHLHPVRHAGHSLPGLRRPADDQVPATAQRPPGPHSPRTPHAPRPGSVPPTGRGSAGLCHRWSHCRRSGSLQRRPLRRQTAVGRRRWRSSNR